MYGTVTVAVIITVQVHTILFKVLQKNMISQTWNICESENIIIACYFLYVLSLRAVCRCFRPFLVKIKF